LRLEKIVVSTILLLILTLAAVPVKSQEGFLIGLNMEVEFIECGIARVTLKQHPFDPSGRSLISDEDVVNEIIGDEDSMIKLILLFFSTNPSKTSFRVISHSELKPDEEVLCNTGTPGVMERFEGAILLTVEIFLNTTSNMVRLDDDIYRIVVTDYFTLTDPRSWIDVMDLRFSGNVKLLNFSADPSWSKPPNVANSTRLQWLNTNEADAPDNYFLTLKIPGVVFSSIPQRLRAEILETKYSNVSSSFSVKIRNTGGDAGVFIVVLSERGYEQARKVALKSGEEAWVNFPIHVGDREEVVIKILGNGEKLDEERIVLKAEKPKDTLPLILGGVGLVLTVLGILAMLLYLKDRFKKTTSVPEGFVNVNPSAGDE
jgi:hypothetical protein